MPSILSRSFPATLVTVLRALSFGRQGEPGVGKTMLVEECGREWQREGVQVRAMLDNPDLHRPCIVAKLHLYRDWSIQQNIHSFSTDQQSQLWNWNCV